ncbi:MAG: histidinol-phosphate transaminase [Endomicrobiales bacterium]
MKKITLDIKKMIRPSCADFQPYVAGRPIEAIKRELGLKKVIKLASNENPLGPSPRALSALGKAMAGIFFYPDSNAWLLRKALADFFALAPENIVLGSGSDEIIELLAKAFFKPTDDIIVSEHAFIRYRMAGELMGCRVKTVPMKGFTHDLAAMAKAAGPRTKAIFIANPNNPTGTYNTKAEWESFLKALHARGKDQPLVIVDEAYYEYARPQEGYPETQGYLAAYPHLVILRTFSKIYGLAGLRVGYGFASRDVVDYLDRIRPPFNVNSLAQVAAVASLGDDGQVDRSMALIQEQKKYLYRALGRMNVPFVPTAANFILINVSPRSGQEVFRELLRLGIIVRAMDEYQYPSHVRVTIGLPSENKSFINALKKVI